MSFEAHRCSPKCFLINTKLLGKPYTLQRTFPPPSDPCSLQVLWVSRKLSASGPLHSLLSRMLSSRMWYKYVTCFKTIRHGEPPPKSSPATLQMDFKYSWKTFEKCKNLSSEVFSFEKNKRREWTKLLYLEFPSEHQNNKSLGINEKCKMYIKKEENNSVIKV